MSGINCGTYPAKKYEDALLIIQDQNQELDILTSDLDDLQLGVDAADAVYSVRLADTDTNNAGAVTAYLAKPIYYFFDTTLNTQSITTAAETRVFTNTLNTATFTGDSTMFFNTNVNFLTPEIAPLNGILWRAYVNSVIVSEYIQDFGQYVITDTGSRWNMQFLFEIPQGTATNSTYVTARLLASTTMDVGVRYGIRYSCLSHVFD